MTYDNHYVPCLAARAALGISAEQWDQHVNNRRLAIVSINAVPCVNIERLCGLIIHKVCRKEDLAWLGLDKHIVSPGDTSGEWLGAEAGAALVGASATSIRSWAKRGAIRVKKTCYPHAYNREDSIREAARKGKHRNDA